MAKIKKKLRNCSNTARARRMNPNTVPKVKSGISQLDKFLKGGIPVGFVTALAAEEAAGKSTLCVQLSLSAAEQNIPTFTYYGEDPEEFIKDKVVHMLGGSFALDDTLDEYGELEKEPNSYCQVLIEDWLDGYLHNWEPEPLEMNKLKVLAEDIEEFANECGEEPGLVILDNLMKISDFGDWRMDLNSRQSFICNMLSDLAKKLKTVAIVLVVHTRKALEVGGNDNNNISGTANIKNSAGLIIQYARDENDRDSNIRKVRVTKNRLYGKTNSKNAMTVAYDEDTMRTFSVDDVDAMFYEYGWLKELKERVKNGDATDFEKEMVATKSVRVEKERKRAKELAKVHKEQRKFEQDKAIQIAQEEAFIKEANRRARYEKAKNKYKSN